MKSVTNVILLVKNVMDMVMTDVLNVMKAEPYPKKRNVLVTIKHLLLMMSSVVLVMPDVTIVMVHNQLIV